MKHLTELLRKIEVFKKRYPYHERILSKVYHFWYNQADKHIKWIFRKRIINKRNYKLKK